MLTKTTLLILTTIGFLMSCKTELEVPDDPKFNDTVATEVIAEFIDDDIEKIVLSQLFNFYLTRGVSADDQTHEVNNPFEHRTSCSIRTTNTTKTQVVIDYGAGCIDDKGRFRRGKITANLSEKKGIVFGRVEITLENYQYESILVSGDRLLTVNVDTPRQYEELQSSITKGTLTFDNNSIYRYQSDRAITWDFTDSDQNKFFYTIEFQKTGKTRDQQDFQSLSMTNISYRSTCFDSGTGQINNGSLRINTAEKIFTLDFRETGCLQFVNVFENDQDAYEMDLSSLLINR